MALSTASPLPSHSSSTLPADLAGQAIYQRLVDNIQQVVKGQPASIRKLLAAFASGGHVLLEDHPGTGNTTLAKALAFSIDINFKRIQFTPDLMPADITGTELLQDDPVKGTRELKFMEGPVFTNLLLADEINRATPKTQSALLETMQEKSVTVAGQTHELELPFFVLATQYPIEQDGTYPLPEAQLDRFFFKLFVELPSHDEFSEILKRTGGTELPEIQPVIDAEEVLRMGRLFRQVPIDDAVQEYLVRVVMATHPENETAPEKVKQYLRHGSSPRGAQSILAASRVRALLDGRYHVAKEDIAAAAIPALRHRIILSFEGEADGMKPDDLVKEAIASAQ